MSVQRILDLLSTPGKVDYRELARELAESEFINRFPKKDRPMVDMKKLESELSKVSGITDGTLTKLLALPGDQRFYHALLDEIMSSYSGMGPNAIYIANTAIPRTLQDREMSPIHLFVEACERHHQQLISERAATAIEKILVLLTAPGGVDYEQLAREFVRLCKNKAGKLVLDHTLLRAELNKIRTLPHDDAVDKLTDTLIAIPNDRAFLDALIKVAAERFHILSSGLQGSVYPEYAGPSSPVYQFAENFDLYFGLDKFPTTAAIIAEVYEETPPTRPAPRARALTPEEMEKPPARPSPRAPAAKPSGDSVRLHKAERTSTSPVRPSRSLTPELPSGHTETHAAHGHKHKPKPRSI